MKTKKTYNFSLNKDGVGGLVGLKNGEYTLREISNQCNDDLDMNEYYLKFSEDNKSYEFIPSSIDESALVILILDENGNGVPNIKIKLYDNSAKLVLSAKSSDKGVIAFEKLSTKDSNLYYVVQDGIDNPQKFFVQIKKDGAVGLKLNLNNEGYLE